MSITLVLLGGGNSTRFSQKTKKQWLRVGKIPLWLSVVKSFEEFDFDKIIIVAKYDEIAYMQNFTEYSVVNGGDTRQNSLINALKFVETEHVMVSDIARCCVSKDVVKKLIASKNKADIIVPFIGVDDSVVYKNMTIDRDKVKLIQTPQLSKSLVLKKSLKQEEVFTDDSSAIRSLGGSVHFVEGCKSLAKLTRIEDLKLVPCLKKAEVEIRVGHGFDVHKFNQAPPLMLGGVEIECDYGFEAHSDGDVLIHALIDALLGAVGAGDIGELFPDNDDNFKGASSLSLLKKVVLFLENIGARVVNVDVTVMAEKPRLSKYKVKIRQTLGSVLNLESIDVNVKATTTEKLGFIGRGEGVAVEAIAQVMLGENL